MTDAPRTQPDEMETLRAEIAEIRASVIELQGYRDSISDITESLVEAKRTAASLHSIASRALEMIHCRKVDEAALVLRSAAAVNV